MCRKTGSTCTLQIKYISLIFWQSIQHFAVAVMSTLPVFTLYFLQIHRFSYFKPQTIPRITSEFKLKHSKQISINHLHFIAILQSKFTFLHLAKKKKKTFYIGFDNNLTKIQQKDYKSDHISQGR